MMDEATVEVDPLIDAVSRFDEKSTATLALLVKRQNFWREAILEGIEIPWDAYSNTSSYGNSTSLAQYEPYDKETGRSDLDAEATRKEFAKVVKWAKKNGWTVEKKYDDDTFYLYVHDTPIGKLEFYSTRQVVCEKVQVGTKTVEAVPEHEEPVYEYKCDKVAFLRIDV